MLTLFDVPPYQAHSATSREASKSMVGKTASLREQVFTALKFEPMTDEAICQRLGLSPNTARPRRVELVKAGRIAKVGENVTASGRKAAVWGVPSTSEV
jgi:predicted ArsR family transcriptional regulator